MPTGVLNVVESWVSVIVCPDAAAQRNPRLPHDNANRRGAVMSLLLGLIRCLVAMDDETQSWTIAGHRTSDKETDSRDALRHRTGGRSFATRRARHERNNDAATASRARGASSIDARSSLPRREEVVALVVDDEERG